MWGVGTLLSVPHEATLSTVPRARQLLDYRVDWVENEYWSGPYLTFYPSGYNHAELLDLWTKGLKSALSTPVLKYKDSYGPCSQSLIAHSYYLLLPLTLLQVRPVPATVWEIHGWLGFLLWNLLLNVLYKYAYFCLVMLLNEHINKNIRKDKVESLYG